MSWVFRLIISIILIPVNIIVKRRRLKRLKRIKEAMPSRSCPICWSYDTIGGKIKDNIVPMECRACHHIWTLKIPPDLVGIWNKGMKQRVG